MSGSLFRGVRALLLLALVASGFLALSAVDTSAQAGPTDPKEGTTNYAQRRAYYDSTLSRPSFRWRCRGIVTLASGSDAEAIDVLFARYRKPENPEDHIRYAIANVTKQYYDIREHAVKLQQFSDTLKDPSDSWYQLMVDMIRGDKLGYDELLALARNERQPMLRRVTAIYAMKDAGPHNLLPLVTDLLEAKRPSKPHDLSLLLEACSFALRHGGGVDRSAEEYEKAFEALGVLFDDKKIPDRTKLVMGRQLAKLYGIDDVYVNWDGWRGVHMGDRHDAIHGPGTSRTRVPPPKGPTFAGLKASGRNICFVLDLSCSMLQRVNKPKDIQPPPPKPRRPPTTGGGRGQKKDDEDKEETPPPRDEDLLPWDKIKNRFDLAREYLYLSLDRLEPDMTFCVVLFGSNAERMPVTRGMVKATPGNIAAVKRALDNEKIGPRTQHKPLGTLRGDTNIHGGFLRAFESNARGTKPRYEYVDEAGFLEGCDTIFLLSDGDPNVDDFVATDIWEEGIRVVHDRESGVAAPKTDNINYQGPYGQGDWLVLDLYRLNLFRHVEIHCVGMGKEANQGLLTRIAEAGLGKVKMLGNFD